MDSTQSESLTIRQRVVPRLQAAGWSDTSWRREHQITNGRLSVVDGRVRQGQPWRADFALLHGDHPIAVVEVKKTLLDVHDGVQQARDYAAALHVPVAYATNGARIIEIDMRAQKEREVDSFRGGAGTMASLSGRRGP